MKKIRSILFLLTFQILNITFNAQNFTWISGSNLRNMPATFDTIGVPSSTNTPGGRSHAATWSDQAGNLWMYGGRFIVSNVSYDKADLWKFNVTTGEWTFVTGTTTNFYKAKYGQQGIPSVTNTPGSRSGCATWTDSIGNFWLFGGKESGSNNFLNDVWKYNPATKEWTFVKGPSILNQQGVYGTMGQAHAGNCPSARSECAYWKDKAGNFWLFGGLENITSSINYFNDVWRYNITTNEWTWISGSKLKNQLGVYGLQGVPSSTITPGARSGMVSTTGKHGEFWLFGSYGFGATGASGFLNDLWKYDPQNNTWTFVAGTSTVNQLPVNGVLGLPDTLNRPGGKTGAIGWSDKHGDLWLFGGTANNVPYNTLWKYTVAEGTWKRLHGNTAANDKGFYGNKMVSSPTNTPPSRGYAHCWKDTAQNFWLMGGVGPSVNGTGALNDIWKFETCEPESLIISSPRPTACIGEDLLITVTGATSFTWSNGSHANQLPFKAIADSTYVVAGRDQKGCLNSTSFTQRTTDCSALNESDQVTQIAVFPNPSKGSITIRSERPINEIIVRDLTGRIVQNTFGHNEDEKMINLLVPPGIYLCTIVTNAKNSRVFRISVVE